MRLMFLGWLSRLLASLLVSFLFLAVLGFMLSQTVFNPPYLRSQLKAANAYSQLSSAISKQIVQSNENNAAIPATPLSQQLQSILTPQLIQQKLDSTIAETQAYYNGNGPVPSLDLSKEATQLQAAGVQLPQGTDYSRPIQFNALSKLKGTKKLVNNSVLTGIGTILLLIAGIIAIAVKRRNYRPLANIFLSLSFLLGLGGVAMLLIPHLTNHLITSSTNQLAAVARDLATNITHDIGKRLVIAAIISLLLGLGGRLLIRRLAHKSLLQSPSTGEPDHADQLESNSTAPTDLPAPDTKEPPVHTTV